ncbi:chalcone isomerase family protein [Psychrosphaera aestuarii]|uniref:chalcone isomerase family protein n=1 Tax=Psychrosphaera aestuarii TaxID=1266052 RepID=UPI001B33A22D|nr:chalcone isomerase family protein [Psychrosphaera aestuarii]
MLKLKTATTAFVLVSLTSLLLFSPNLLSKTTNFNSVTYSTEKGLLTLSNGESYKLSGKAEFSYLFWDVYDSYLYNQSGKFVSSKKWYEQAPLVLEIRYKRDIKAKDLVDSTVEQWQHLKIAEQEYLPYVGWLNEIWPNLKEGDRLALYMFSDRSVFFYNNRFLAEHEGGEFGKIFLDIWLSDDTSEPKLRKKLLSYK